MTDQHTRLRRMQLDDALRPFRSAKMTSPRSGWVRAIREALGMSPAQLAARVGVSRQVAQRFEKAEVQRHITLDSLDRLARAMGCRLVYALVPDGGSLEDLRRRRADEVARELVKHADHSMKLEAQGVSESERERQRKLLAEDLLQGSPRKLWK